MQAERIVRTVDAGYRLCAACLLLLVAVGCRQSPTTVSGKVTMDGYPLVVGSDARGTITFQPANGQGTIAAGLLDTSGHFNLATGGSIEVAPGKYQVAVSVVRLSPKSDNAEQGTELITPAKYASMGESDLQANVAPGENRLSFNLISSAEDRSSTSPDASASSNNQPGKNPN
jgi:hypothetical protein